ncbi:MAG: iron ABC transporter permease [Crocinitomicaceae bacterium]|jgi:iron complex transport system permease protein|nr:iron ABC transporter permease [Crocinitomicaceae bacterium]
MNNRLKWILLTLLPLVAILLHLATGEIEVSLNDYWNSLFHFDPSNVSHQIIREFRWPRIFMGLMAGGALSIAGLLMQTLFQNPLAGPYVLGVNSGSSLFVALGLLTGWELVQTDLGLVSAAFIGATLVAVLILTLSFYLRNSLSLLLVGIMIGSFTSAIISILQSASEVNSLKVFTLWAMGSLQHVGLDQVPFIAILFTFGITGAFMVIKPLNAMVLGDSSAQLLGIAIKKNRTFIIIVTVLLTALITAYCGPIAFVGLAVPNLIRILFKTQNHRVLVPATLIFGASFLVLCDVLVQLMVVVTPIPINAITSLVGAPMVIYFILKKLA